MEMRSDDFISVIVPVYNDAMFLSRCVDSILSQTYQNFELLLIDDGSTDGTEMICDKYGAQDKRVSVVHKKNGGVSSARNYGLNLAMGKYICFADADDYVEPNWLAVLYETIMRYPEALVVCNIEIQEPNNRYLRYSCESQLMAIETFWSMPEWGNIYNKMFRKDVIQALNLRFDITQKVHEDELFIGLYGSAFNNAYVCKEALYHYLYFEPLGEKYKDSLTLENAFYEYQTIKKVAPFCANTLVDRLLMSFYDSVQSERITLKDGLGRFKDAVGPDIIHVKGRKKILFRMLHWSKADWTWRLVFRLYLLLDFI